MTYTFLRIPVVNKYVMHRLFCLGQCQSILLGVNWYNPLQPTRKSMRGVVQFRGIVLTNPGWSIHFGYFVFPDGIKSNAVTENRVGFCDLLVDPCYVNDVLHTFV